MTSKKSKAHLTKLIRKFVPKSKVTKRAVLKGGALGPLPVTWVAANGKCVLLANDERELAWVSPHPSPTPGANVHWYAMAKTKQILDSGVSLDETTAMLMATLAVINEGIL
jgi:hypothetical protein